MVILDNEESSEGEIEMTIEVLLFDVGSTVFDWRTAVVRTLENTVSDSLSSVDKDKFAVVFRKHTWIEQEEIASEEVPWRPFTDVLRSSLDLTLSELGIDGISTDDRDLLYRAWDEMPVWPEVPVALERLRRKYYTSPLTVMSLRAVAYSSKNAGISWDSIISCDMLGVTKYNPRSYQRAFELIGCAPEQVCFVAAHPGDLRAASAQGTKTAYVVARLHDHGEDYEDKGFAEEFDYVADNFIHLAELMSA